MRSLALRNILFTILQPGIVAGVIPYYIAREDFQDAFAATFGIGQWMGIVLSTIGAAITGYCIIEFATRGQGTLSPADPTQKLVTTGLYRYSRNPMYIGVTALLVGEAMFTQSLYLFVYSALVFAAFCTFVVVREEPRLHKSFGREYEMYRARVRRWF